MRNRSEDTETNDFNQRSESPVEDNQNFRTASLAQLLWLRMKKQEREDQLAIRKINKNAVYTNSEQDYIN